MNTTITFSERVDPRRVDRLRAKLRNQSIREMRSAGRYDYSQAELDAVVTSRLDNLLAKLESAGQGQLPLMDVGQVACETKRQSCHATLDCKVEHMRFQLCGPLALMLEKFLVGEPRT